MATKTYMEVDTGKKITVAHAYKAPNWKRDKNIKWDMYRDEDLIEWANKGKNVPSIQVSVVGSDGLEHTVEVKGTEAFQAHYKTEFDYNQLSYELTRRGAVNGYHFPNHKEKTTYEKTEPIVLDLDEYKRTKTVRLQLTVSEEMAELLDSLVPYEDSRKKSTITDMLLTHALKNLLEMKSHGKIKVSESKEVKKIEKVVEDL